MMNLLKKFLTLLFKILAMLILIHSSKALMEIVVSVMSIIDFSKKIITGNENDFLAICKKAWIYVNEKKTNIIPISDPLHLLKNFRTCLLFFCSF